MREVTACFDWDCRFNAHFRPANITSDGPYEEQTYSYVFTWDCSGPKAWSTPRSPLASGRHSELYVLGRVWVSGMPWTFRCRMTSTF